MRRILLVRHGTTEWVDKHILHGMTDIPLNENGKRQAHEAADVLKFERAVSLYTSPLERSRQTAEIIGDQVGLKPQILDGMKELDFGWLEGRRFRDHGSQNYSYLIKIYDQFAHHIIRAITGESIVGFRHRILEAWDHILAENLEGTIIIVGHSAVFNNILIHYFGKNFPKGQTYYALEPGSITEIMIDEQDHAQLVRLNDFSHLTEVKH